jgi:hypothetical protein
MASKSDAGAREMESYVDTGSEKSIQITLSGTPGTVTTVSLPDEAKGFRMYPDNACRFGINQTPAAIATSSATTIASSAFALGGIAKASAWETRLLPSPVKTKATDLERTLQLRSTTASVVIELEIF